ncbi:MAG: hypothetical protein ACLUNO_07580 [Oscillospiraceae bacterium]
MEYMLRNKGIVLTRK